MQPAVGDSRSHAIVVLVQNKLTYTVTATPDYWMDAIANACKNPQHDLLAAEEDGRS